MDGIELQEVRADAQLIEHKPLLDSQKAGLLSAALVLMGLGMIIAWKAWDSHVTIQWYSSSGIEGITAAEADILLLSSGLSLGAGVIAGAVGVRKLVKKQKPDPITLGLFLLGTILVGYGVGAITLRAHAEDWWLYSRGETRYATVMTSLSGVGQTGIVLTAAGGAGFIGAAALYVLRDRKGGKS
jgi:hypothetical protein